MPIKAAKASNVANMTSLLEQKVYFSTPFHRFSGGVNTEKGEFDSELWDSNKDLRDPCKR
jgi:hypothetical protein